MQEKPRVVKSHDVILDPDYIQWISDLKQRFRNSQIKAAVKVNSEQLLFNWQLGRDLVERKAEEKWGSGIVEQVSLDLQAEFPQAKGFSARNLWFMKQWYTFYASYSESTTLVSRLEEKIDLGSSKLKQVASEIHEEKMNQLASEMVFPAIFAYVPWMHHVLIVQKSKTVEEALFYIKKTVEEGLSRNALDTPMGVATYKNVQIEEIQKHIPTAEQIKEQVEIAEKEYEIRKTLRKATEESK